MGFFGRVINDSRLNIAAKHADAAVSVANKNLSFASQPQNMESQSRMPNPQQATQLHDRAETSINVEQEATNLSPRNPAGEPPLDPTEEESPISLPDRVSRRSQNANETARGVLNESAPVNRNPAESISVHDKAVEPTAPADSALSKAAAQIADDFAPSEPDQAITGNGEQHSVLHSVRRATGQAEVPSEQSHKLPDARAPVVISAQQTEKFRQQNMVANENDSEESVNNDVYDSIQAFVAQDVREISRSSILDPLHHAEMSRAENENQQAQKSAQKLPRVHIGKVNVFVENPAEKTEHSDTSVTEDNSSRDFLRSL